MWLEELETSPSSTSHPHSSISNCIYLYSLLTTINNAKSLTLLAFVHLFRTQIPHLYLHQQQKTPQGSKEKKQIALSSLKSTTMRFLIRYFSCKLLFLKSRATHFFFLTLKLVMVNFFQRLVCHVIHYFRNPADVIIMSVNGHKSDCELSLVQMKRF